MLAGKSTSISVDKNPKDRTAASRCGRPVCVGRMRIAPAARIHRAVGGADAHAREQHGNAGVLSLFVFCATPEQRPAPFS